MTATRRHGHAPGCDLWLRGANDDTPCSCGVDRVLIEHPGARLVTIDDVTEPDAPLPTIEMSSPFSSAEGDPTFALEMAAKLLAPCFCEQAGCTKAGAVAAADTVTAVADRFVAWLRRPVRIKFGPATVTEQDTGEIVSTAGGSMATIDTSQIVTWTVDPEDDRGFDVTTPLTVTNSDDSVATVVYTPPSAGVLGTIAATAVAPGSTLITVTATGTDPLITGSLNVDVVVGGVAVINFGEPEVTEQP